MSKIRVMIVDDSTVIRRLLTDSLSADPAIEVVGVAANGKIALAKLPQLKPDLVTLDVEMPEMNGLETLVELRKLYPKLPVIMFSTLTGRGAQVTLEALAKGATDYVTKPSNVGSVNAAIQSVQTDLIPKIKTFCRWKDPNPAANIPVKPFTPNPIFRTATTTNGSRPNRVDAVVVGTSTGGPNALSTVIPKIALSFPVPILMVQHMPPIFTTHLAERLNNISVIDVFEATDGMIVEPGKAYLAPGNFHMTVRRTGTQLRVYLNQEAPECSCRPAVDVLFRSAAQLFGPNLLAVVLTGMGQDGARGCQDVRQVGGRVIAQDEATSVVWGMPGAVARAGLAQQLLPLNRIAEEITLQVQSGRIGRPLELAGTQSA